MGIVRRRVDALVALGLVAIAVGVSAPAWFAPTEWRPDSLFYQAQLLELRGADAGAARQEVFSGPLADPRRDSPTVGDPHWVDYSAQFYRRRWVDPAVGAAVYPLLRNASLLAISVGAFVLCAPALCLLLRRRWSVAASGFVAAATLHLAPLRHWSFLPLSDRTGLLLELVALLAAVVVLDRGLRRLPFWILAVAALSVARDATFVIVAGLAWAAVRHRSRRAAWLACSGLLAALPAPLLFGAPFRTALAYTLDGFQAEPDTSWGGDRPRLLAGCAQSRAERPRLPRARAVPRGARARGLRAPLPAAKPPRRPRSCR
jgi:hypothetical protein